MEIERILERLCTLSGPSGFERPVAQAARELLEPLMDQVSLSPMQSMLSQ